MAVIHFLNVKKGDCSIIQHNTGHVTVIDVCNAKADTSETQVLDEAIKVLRKLSAPGGNFNEKAYPVNPLRYMKDAGIAEVFRFILTHPDMDHLDGIRAFWKAFGPVNFWDTANTCEKTNEFGNGSPYDQRDWEFYKGLRSGTSPQGSKRLTLYSGGSGKYWNQGDDAASGGDGLHILAPTLELVHDANECDDFNDASYVLLYRVAGFRILFGGDSHDKTWEHILASHRQAVGDIDLLIAPHHGRKSGRDYSFLDVLRPKMTFFGNANSEHLAYDAWNYRGLPFITNNQAGCMIAREDADGSCLDIYVTNEAFARAKNQFTFFSEPLRAWYVQEIPAKARSAAAS